MNILPFQAGKGTSETKKTKSEIVKSNYSASRQATEDNSFAACYIMTAFRMEFSVLLPLTTVPDCSSHRSLSYALAQ